MSGTVGLPTAVPVGPGKTQDGKVNDDNGEGDPGAPAFFRIAVSAAILGVTMLAAYWISIIVSKVALWTCATAIGAVGGSCAFYVYNNETALLQVQSRVSATFNQIMELVFKLPFFSPAGQ